MPLVTTPEFRRKRNLAMLEDVGRDLAKLGLKYVWDRQDEEACYPDDYDLETQARIRAKAPKPPYDRYETQK